MYYTMVWGLDARVGVGFLDLNVDPLTSDLHTSSYLLNVRCIQVYRVKLLSWVSCLSGPRVRMSARVGGPTE
jgi:hypothetical protein